MKHMECLRAFLGNLGIGKLFFPLLRTALGSNAQGNAIAKFCEVFCISNHRMSTRSQKVSSILWMHSCDNLRGRLFHKLAHNGARLSLALLYAMPLP